MKNKMKIKCGDANPKGNVYGKYIGGCYEEMDITEAYRCTGCGGFFHLDCIYNHFEQDKWHDFAHHNLKKIKDFAEKKMKKSKYKDDIVKLANKGLDRQKDNKRLNI